MFSGINSRGERKESSTHYLRCTFAAWMAVLSLCLVVSLLFISCSQSNGPPVTAPVGPPPGEDGLPFAKTASEYFRDNNIRVGWNIGNSLDAYTNGVAGETSWSNPRISQVLVDSGKEAGFDIVRIPVTWMGHIGGAPNYTISPERLNRVGEVANYAKNAGLKAIINLHHDGHTENTTKEDGWLSVKKSLASAADKLAITEKYTRLWQQIAEHFKDYDDFLIFEAFNELHDGTWSQNPAKAQYDIVNEWTQIFVDTVRASGGNNGKRYLVIPSYNTSAQALLNNNFILPADTVDYRLIVAFHYYLPNNFALDGNSATWDTTGSRSDVTTKFRDIKLKFIDYDIPVIIGETGPVRNRNEAGDANRIPYINFLYGEAKRFGLVPVYWDNGSFGRGGNGFGVFSRINGGPYTGMGDVIQAMTSAVK